MQMYNFCDAPCKCTIFVQYSHSIVQKNKKKGPHHSIRSSIPFFFVRWACNSGYGPVRVQAIVLEDVLNTYLTHKKPKTSRAKFSNRVLLG